MIAHSLDEPRFGLPEKPTGAPVGSFECKTPYYSHIDHRQVSWWVQKLKTMDPYSVIEILRAQPMLWPYVVVVLQQGQASPMFFTDISSVVIIASSWVNNADELLVEDPDRPLLKLFELHDILPASGVHKHPRSQYTIPLWEVASETADFIVFTRTVMSNAVATRAMGSLVQSGKKVCERRYVASAFLEKGDDEEKIALDARDEIALPATQSFLTFNFTGVSLKDSLVHLSLNQYESVIGGTESFPCLKYLSVEFPQTDKRCTLSDFIAPQLEQLHVSYDLHIPNITNMDFHSEEDGFRGRTHFRLIDRSFGSWNCAHPTAKYPVDGATLDLSFTRYFECIDLVTRQCGYILSMCNLSEVVALSVKDCESPLYESDGVLLSKLKQLKVVLIGKFHQPPMILHDCPALEELYYFGRSNLGLVVAPLLLKLEANYANLRVLSIQHFPSKPVTGSTPELVLSNVTSFRNTLTKLILEGVSAPFVVSQPVPFSKLTNYSLDLVRTTQLCANAQFEQEYSANSHLQVRLFKRCALVSSMAIRVHSRSWKSLVVHHEPGEYPKKICITGFTKNVKIGDSKIDLHMWSWGCSSRDLMYWEYMAGKYFPMAVCVD